MFWHKRNWFQLQNNKVEAFEILVIFQSESKYGLCDFGNSYTCRSQEYNSWGRKLSHNKTLKPQECYKESMAFHPMSLSTWEVFLIPFVFCITHKPDLVVKCRKKVTIYLSKKMRRPNEKKNSFEKKKPSTAISTHTECVSHKITCILKKTTNYVFH